VVSRSRVGRSAAAQEPALAKAGGNLLARWGTTKTTTGGLALAGGHDFEAVALTGQRVTTNIGILRDPGHAEPWIIAMSAKPGYRTTLGYADRWGIEPMFSDFKSRGFGLEQTHIQYPDRLARLIQVMSLALYWAVSTGMWDQVNNPIPAEKKTGPSACQARPRKALLVHAGPPARHQTPPQMPPSPETLGMPIKLMNAQPCGPSRR
jgi:hypothetical protein